MSCVEVKEKALEKMTASVLDAFTIEEGNEKDSLPVRSKYRKVGTAFVNRDGSINVIVDQMPANGRLHLRPKYEAREN